MTTRRELEAYLADLLEVERLRDYGPNGLHVQGKPPIRKLVSGVTLGAHLGVHLGVHLAERLGLERRFIDIDHPA